MNWESRLVLVAEDSDDDFMLLMMAFRKANFRNPVRRVENGQEAIYYLLGEEQYADRQAFPFPYVLLLDLKMPVMHGLEVLAWARQNAETRRLPVVMLTSSLQPLDVQESYDRGANGFVTKSSSLEGLVDVVAAIHAFWVKVNNVEQ